MIKLIVLFLVCIEISTGNYEEYSGYNGFPSIDTSGTPNLETPVNNRDHQVRRPCPHRRNNPDQEWVPSYKSTITEPFTNYGLEPQSLKNENINDENKAAEKLPAETNGEILVNNDEQTLDEYYDCENELDTETQVSSKSYPITSVGVEQKAIELLKDCLNKKQKHIEDKLQHDGEIITGSRRSIGEPDIEHENDNSDDLAPTTEVSEDKSEVLAPGFTLGPGKLYNELEYQTKASRIAKYPVSRRMQDSSRMCYACSSSTNPTCWAPDNKTTIKYCKEGQHCITKNFGEKDTLTVIRDCAESCDATGIPGLDPKYKKCKICHKDLCNSAAINGYNIIIIFFIFSFKCAF